MNKYIYMYIVHPKISWLNPSIAGKHICAGLLYPLALFCADFGNCGVNLKSIGERLQTKINTEINFLTVVQLSK